MERGGEIKVGGVGGGEEAGGRTLVALSKYELSAWRDSTSESARFQWWPCDGAAALASMAAAAVSSSCAVLSICGGGGVVKDGGWGGGRLCKCIWGGRDKLYFLGS